MFFGLKKKELRCTNPTPVCTMAGYYSTNRPLVLYVFFFFHNPKSIVGAAMVERFFPVAQTDFRSPNEADSLILLSGPPSSYVAFLFLFFYMNIYVLINLLLFYFFSGKSSLLFQYAFNAAMDGNRELVFICNRRKLEINPPYLAQALLQLLQLSFIFPSFLFSSTFSFFILGAESKFPAGHWSVFSSFSTYTFEVRLKKPKIFRLFLLFYPQEGKT